MIKGVPLTPTLFRQYHSEAFTQKLTTQIAEFLSTLHSFPVEKAVELGVSRNQKKERILTLYQWIQQKVFPILKRQEQEWTRNRFESFLKNEQFFLYTPVLIHGDFSSDHILFDKDQAKIGIIDFGDVTIGDPAGDFSCLADYGVTFDQQVQAKYQSNIDSIFLQRRTFYRDCIGFWEILGGIDLNNPKYVDIGLIRLRKTIQANKSNTKNVQS
ncbi:MAG: phosphotransferase family protein [Candidatus Heimdallarchaeota archaeon]